MGFQESRAAAIKTIVLHIVLCLLTFYTIYYMIGSVCCGVFRLQSFSARLPFEFKMEPSYSNPKYLGELAFEEASLQVLVDEAVDAGVEDWGIQDNSTNLEEQEGDLEEKESAPPFYPIVWVSVISMEATFFCSGLLFAVMLKQWVWDYAVTVASIHLLLTWAVMEEFPLVWQWWLALAGGLFFMICNGEFITYFVCPESNSPGRDSFF